MNSTIYIITAIIVLLFLFKLVFYNKYLYFNTSKKELFTGQQGILCNDCNNLSFNNCINCFNCGYAFMNDNKGMCMSGDVNGPYKYSKNNIIGKYHPYNPIIDESFPPKSSNYYLWNNKCTFNKNNKLKKWYYGDNYSYMLQHPSDPDCKKPKDGIQNTFMININCK